LRKRLDQDIILGISILLISGLFWIQRFKLSGGPAYLPTIALAIMSISGIGIAVNALIKLRKTGKPYKKINKDSFISELILPGGILLTVILLLDIIGFYIGAFLLVIFVCLLQNFIIDKKYKPTVKELAKISVFALGVVAFAYLCFSVLLSIPTPTGVFGI